MGKAQNATALDNTADKFTENMNTPVAETSATDTATSIAVPFSFTDDEIKDIAKHARKVTVELGKAEKAFTSVACEIRWLYEDDRYKALATASSFEQFITDSFGFKKSQGYALCKLVDRFGEQDEKGNFIIKKQYEGYGQSKLICMIPLSDEQIEENITDKMTVAEIRKTVKALTKCDTLGASPAQNGQEEQAHEEQAQENVIDAPVATETSIYSLASYSDFDSFESDSPNFFRLVSDAFKDTTHKNVRVIISYEYD